MQIESKDRAIELIFAAIPYSEQIKGLNTTNEQSAIRFKWRGTEYRLSLNGMIEEVGDGVLIGSNQAILMEELIKRQYISELK